MKTRHSKNSFARVTQKSEPSLNDEDVFPQACIDNKPRNVRKEAYVSVV